MNTYRGWTIIYNEKELVTRKYKAWKNEQIIYSSGRVQIERKIDALEILIKKIN